MAAKKGKQGRGGARRVISGKLCVTSEQARLLLRKLEGTGQLAPDDILLLLNASPDAQSVPGPKNPNNYDALIPNEGGYRRDGIWRKTVEAVVDAAHPLSLDERDCDSKPAGLSNLGNTCYMNSALQVLYTNYAFRKAVYNIEKEVIEKSGDAGLKVLRKMFIDLQFGLSAVADPSPLVDLLKLQTGIQQDAEEFQKLLMQFVTDRMAQSKIPEIRTMGKDLFAGTSSYVTQCRKCKKSSARSQTVSEFYELALQVQGMKKLETALSLLVAKEGLTGDNKYRCETCGGLTEADRMFCIRSLPPCLRINLQRFGYDMHSGSKQKFQDAISFPMKLDLTRYISTLDGSAPDPHEYVLTGIVLHRGSSASSGHYVAIIKDDATGTWWKYDDCTVTNMESHPFKGDKWDSEPAPGKRGPGRPRKSTDPAEGGAEGEGKPDAAAESKDAPKEKPKRVRNRKKLPADKASQSQGAAPAAPAPSAAEPDAQGDAQPSTGAGAKPKGPAQSRSGGKQAPQRRKAGAQAAAMQEAAATIVEAKSQLAPPAGVPSAGAMLDQTVQRCRGAGEPVADVPASAAAVGQKRAPALRARTAAAPAAKKPRADGGSGAAAAAAPKRPRAPAGAAPAAKKAQTAAAAPDKAAPAALPPSGSPENTPASASAGPSGDADAAAKAAEGGAKGDDAGAGPQELTSKDAYMLLYTRVGCSHSRCVSWPGALDDLPADLAEEVRGMVASHHDDVKAQMTKRDALQSGVEEQRACIKAIVADMPVPDGADYRMVDSEWLNKWANAAPGEDLPPIDNGSLACEHNRLNPVSWSWSKRVSVPAWAAIHAQCRGGPEFGPRDVCLQCCHEALQTIVDKEDTDDHRKHILEEVKSALDSGRADVQDGVLVSRKWLQNWKIKACRVDTLADMVSPTANITCPHKQLLPEKDRKGKGTNRVAVTRETFDFLKQHWNRLNAPAGGPQLDTDAPNGHSSPPDGNDEVAVVASDGTVESAKKGSGDAPAAKQAGEIHEFEVLNGDPVPGIECPECASQLTTSAKHDALLKARVADEKARLANLLGSAVELEPGQTVAVVPRSWMLAWRSWVGGRPWQHANAAAVESGSAPDVAIATGLLPLDAAFEQCAVVVDGELRLLQELPAVSSGTRNRGRWHQEDDKHVLQIVTWEDWLAIKHFHGSDSTPEIKATFVLDTDPQDDAAPSQPGSPQPCGNAEPHAKAAEPSDRTLQSTASEHEATAAQPATSVPEGVPHASAADQTEASETKASSAPSAEQDSAAAPAAPLSANALEPAATAAPPAPADSAAPSAEQGPAPAADLALAQRVQSHEGTDRSAAVASAAAAADRSAAVASAAAAADRSGAGAARTEKGSSQQAPAASRARVSPLVRRQLMGAAPKQSNAAGTGDAQAGRAPGQSRESVDLTGEADEDPDDVQMVDAAATAAPAAPEQAAVRPLGAVDIRAGSTECQHAEQTGITPDVAAGDGGAAVPADAVRLCDQEDDDSRTADAGSAAVERAAAAEPAKCCIDVEERGDAGGAASSVHGSGGEDAEMSAGQDDDVVVVPKRAAAADAAPADAKMEAGTAGDDGCDDGEDAAEGGTAKRKPVPPRGRLVSDVKVCVATIKQRQLEALQAKLQYDGVLLTCQLVTREQAHSAKDLASNSKRSRRGRATTTASSSTSLRQLKLQLYESLQVHPASMDCYVRGEHLQEDDAPLGALGVCYDDVVNVVDNEGTAVDDYDALVRWQQLAGGGTDVPSVVSVVPADQTRERGFVDTLLVGSSIAVD